MSRLQLPPGAFAAAAQQLNTPPQQVIQRLALDDVHLVSLMASQMHALEPQEAVDRSMEIVSIAVALIKVGELNRLVASAVAQAQAAAQATEKASQQGA